jgi:hypothetical protein
MTDKTISEPARLSEERLRELIRYYKERAIYFEQASDNGRLVETLREAAPNWELHDLLRELLSRRAQGNASPSRQDVQAQGEVDLARTLENAILSCIGSRVTLHRTRAEQILAALQRLPSEGEQAELQHAVENLLAVIDREYGRRQLAWMEGARRRVEEALLQRQGGLPPLPSDTSRGAGPSEAQNELPKGAVSVVKPQGTEETGDDRPAAPISRCYCAETIRNGVGRVDGKCLACGGAYFEHYSQPSEAQKLAELVGDARGEMADYREATAQPSEVKP